MTIVSNKSGIEFSGGTYEVGEKIPLEVVGKQLRQLRAAGKIRTADISERQGYTSGQRFKKYVQVGSGGGNVYPKSRNLNSKSHIAGGLLVNGN